MTFRRYLGKGASLIFQSRGTSRERTLTTTVDFGSTDCLTRGGGESDRCTADQASRPCFVAPSPELKEKLDAELAKIKGRSKSALVDSLALAKEPRALGFNDGMIVPADDFPFGTSDLVMRSGSADRAPLRGTVRVIVVLVDFSDKHMAATQQHFKDLFFSTGVIPTGSVKEYYQEVTGGLVDITGDVVGPYRMPHTNAWYANGNFGIGKPSGTTRARDLAQDAFAAADPHVNFGPYDNDGNGFVDAFIVVHAGSGGEQTGNSNDIWSHKWTLASAQTTDSTKVFGYLTIPEDARIGVCAHELGHLLFGFPDLYDTDDSSEGIGNWCLMAGGSWNGGGDTPAHPSAWCKVNQGWATVTNVTQNGNITVERREVVASRSSGCGRTGPAARSTSCSRTARRPATTRTCRATACCCGTSTTASRPTPTRTTTRWASCRPTACATWSCGSTAETAATRSRARRASPRSRARRRRAPSPTPAPTPASRSRASRPRPPP